VGFVSADLRTHSVAWFLLPLLCALDPRRVQAVAYANGGREDAMTDRLHTACRGWRRIDSMTDSQVVEQVRADGIAQRAAPLQGTWLGYPNTTGLPNMDLRLVDAITDPIDTAQALASERLLRIEGGVLCYRAPEDAPEPAQRDAHAPPTFGSFNNLQKISPSTLDLWAAVLSAEPEASLLLKAGGLEQASVQARLRAAFASRGIAPARLRFLPRTAGVAEHLAAYAEIDVALDTWPYHGTTTTCEALWMGVPVITRVGDCHASRVGASLLAAAGCAGDVSADLDGFVGAARRALARVRADARSRAALRARLAASALTDAAGFADRFTRALERAWIEARARD
jgi:predicted O-linked N-acetylglucosamine transferase (SPINDLY family)